MRLHPLSGVNSLFVPAPPLPDKAEKQSRWLNRMTHICLRAMAANFNYRPGLRPYLKGIDGWIDFSVAIITDNSSVAQAICFEHGRARVISGHYPDADVTMILQDIEILKEMSRSTPNEMLNLILKNKMVIEGNLACLQLFNFFTALLLGKIHQRKLSAICRADRANRKRTFGAPNPELARTIADRRQYRMTGQTGIDPNVKYLADPYLSDYAIEDFPRLKAFLSDHFNTLPELCPERPQLMTRWFRQHGFDTDTEGNAWNPELRQARAFKYLMENKRPIIRERDLIGGTTTAKPVGVTVFPDGHGTMIWGELISPEKRMLNPFVCSTETMRILHHDVFPYWMRRNLRELVRNKFDAPVCQKLDERFVAYFVWKSVGISHTIPDFKKLLTKGTTGIIENIRKRLTDCTLRDDQRNALQSMILALEGINAYAARLSSESRKLARLQKEKIRRNELLHLADVFSKIPADPAESLDEAVNAVWICWVGLHMENANTGLSLGRLDQLLQPYFERDIRNIPDASEREDYVRHAIEMTGCLFMRLTDHVPLLPDIGNYLFGGASSTQAITLGGISPDGGDAVCDMTYVLLKVTEMLSIRDANINARFHAGINSDQYLKRLCEVNILTAATPIMNNDEAVFKAIAPHGYSDSEMRDWAATGCVEPSIQGKHFGHTGSVLLNLVASMEMALNNGRHPVMRWSPGPATGSIEAGDFASFEDFFSAWAKQLRFIIGQAAELNNLYGRAHQEMRPTPLLSALMAGPAETGRDVVRGGALYNSSGTSNIGLVDVTDSLTAIQKLVFDEQLVSFKRLKAAIDNNFAGDPEVLALIRSRVPLFGSGDPEAAAMANRVSRTVHDCWAAQPHYRGGRYTTGFWSMSQHVAYGSLSGTLPSGRLAAKAFTPGLTPSPLASASFLDNIRDVAALDPMNMDNNIAFNVKLTPSPDDSREDTAAHMLAYVKSYFSLGGMQMQFNVVTSEMLKDAMVNPERYPNLMVRISGYNAYFVSLNREIQTELIERTEYGV